MLRVFTESIIVYVDRLHRFKKSCRIQSLNNIKKSKAPKKSMCFLGTTGLNFPEVGV